MPARRYVYLYALLECGCWRGWRLDRHNPPRPPLTHLDCVDHGRQRLRVLA